MSYTTSRISEKRQLVAEIIEVCVIVYHSVLVDKPELQERPHYLEYEAESPDETALIAAVQISECGLFHTTEPYRHPSRFQLQPPEARYGDHDSVR